MFSDCETTAYVKADLKPPYPLDRLRRDLDPERIVEVGSGDGSGALQLIEHFPSARLTCLEPGEAARSTLAWRLADRGHLDGGVSVLPLTVEQAVVEQAVVEQAVAVGPADLVVARHVTCRIATSLRAGFWVALKRLLTSDVVILVDDHFGAMAMTDVPRKKSSQGANGEFTFSHWFAAERVDPDRELARVADAGLAIHSRADGWMLLVADST